MRRGVAGVEVEHDLFAEYDAGDHELRGRLLEWQDHRCRRPPEQETILHTRYLCWLYPREFLHTEDDRDELPASVGSFLVDPPFPHRISAHENISISTIFLIIQLMGVV